MESNGIESSRIESRKHGSARFDQHASLKRDAGRRDKLDLMTVAKKRDMKVERAGRTDRIKF